MKKLKTVIEDIFRVFVCSSWVESQQMSHLLGFVERELYERLKELCFGFCLHNLNGFLQPLGFAIAKHHNEVQVSRALSFSPSFSFFLTSTFLCFVRIYLNACLLCFSVYDCNENCHHIAFEK